MRLPFDFSPDEYTALITALRKKAAELSQALGCEVTPKEALHQMAVEVLETDPASIAAGRVEREGAAHTILYRHCPGCRRSDVETDDGPMEIAPEVIERYEKTAEKLVIRPEEESPPPKEAPDASSETTTEKPTIHPPNTRPFLEKLFLRDGRRCSNPLCRRPLPLQGNHLERRSDGGATALHNENALCIPCHALHTAGLLDISGNPIDGLTFTPRGVKLARSLEREKVSVEAMPVVMVQAATPSATPERKPCEAEEKSVAPEEASALEDATLGLVALGYRKADAGPRARRALESLKKRGDRITAETLLKAALR
jgi:Holliday junction resolvase RuvA-like protein